MPQVDSRLYRDLDPPAGVSHADVGCSTTEGFPKRNVTWRLDATRWRAGDGTLYLKYAAGRSDRLDPPASVSYADVGCSTTEGFPKRNATWSMDATRWRARDGTLYPGKLCGPATRREYNTVVTYASLSAGSNNNKPSSVRLGRMVVMQSSLPAISSA